MGDDTLLVDEEREAARYREQRKLIRRILEGTYQFHKPSDHTANEMERVEKERDNLVSLLDSQKVTGELRENILAAFDKKHAVSGLECLNEWHAEQVKAETTER